MREARVKTTHGTISLRESHGRGVPLVMIHGNSVSQDVFLQQVNHPLLNFHRVITLDLPGHGRSQNAPDPLETYCLPGYADAVLQVLNSIGVERAVLFGWSLGGHIALEILSKWPGVMGVIITGSPPARPGPAGLSEAFQPNPVFGLLSQLDLPDDRVELIAETIVGRLHSELVTAAIRRTDGWARHLLFNSLIAGNAADERSLAETSNVPIAVLDGENEPFTNFSYLEAVKFKALWRGACHRIANAAHAPFLQEPQIFNAYLAAFMHDICRSQNGATDSLGSAPNAWRIPA